MTKITDELVEHFFNNLDVFTTKYECYIEDACNKAYDNNAEVTYYIPGYAGDFENPPEPDDWEVVGYNEYMTDVIDFVSDCVAEFLNLDKDEELIAFVREYIDEIIDIDFTSERIFEENAIEDYRNNL